MGRSLKFALLCTLATTIVVVVCGATLVGTLAAFGAFGLVSEGWTAIAAIVWCLELVFIGAFAAEYFD